MTNTSTLRAYALKHNGWKYYNSIKKKAMEQEFSWSGLAVSLSIAFFVVFVSATALNITYETIMKSKMADAAPEQKIYYLENQNHINTRAFNDLNRLNNKNYINYI